MDRFAALTGRQYHLFDYVGAPDAERVIVVMGSGAETAEETADYLTARGEKVGVIKVHLFRPFSVAHFLNALPPTVQRDRRAGSHQGAWQRRRAAVPGCGHSPQRSDDKIKRQERKNEAQTNVLSSSSSPFSQWWSAGATAFPPRSSRRRWSRASSTSCSKAAPKNHFTIGINDDVTHTSLAYDPAFSIEADETVRCVFWGLGADGTVGRQ